MEPGRGSSTLSGRRLEVFDLDDTLFISLGEHAPSASSIGRDGEARRLSRHDDMVQAMRRGDSVSFEEFRQAWRLERAARPILGMVGRVIRASEAGDAFILTARADLDCKRTVGRFLRKHGIDFSRVRVKRAGNRANLHYVERKALEARNLLSAREYALARFYDDAPEYLDAYARLRHYFRRTRIELYRVDGGVPRLYRT